MTERNETVADIVAEMRRIYPPGPLCEQTVDGQFVHDEMHWLADRIEAAAKRDIEMNRKCAFDTANDFRDIQCRDCVHNPSSDNYEGRVGNAAALREALETVVGALCHLCLFGSTCENDPSGWCAEVSKAKAALAAPPRNCDKPEFSTPEKALEALKARFPVEEWFSGFKVAAEWLLDSADFCLAVPSSRKFGTSPEGGK